jgi:hypothetical protein
MRTTLTIDDDVAAELERLRREKDLSLKEVVNDALRKGLRETGRPPRRRERFQTRPLDVGRCLLPSLDSTAHALALAEGDDFR